MKQKDGMMISCKKATELVEMKFEKKLTFKQNFQLKLHLLLCKICDIYAQQSATLHKMLAVFIQSKKEEKQPVNTDKLKQEIVAKIEKIEG
jgi:hypothetical protein